MSNKNHWWFTSHHIFSKFVQDTREHMQVNCATKLIKRHYLHWKRVIWELPQQSCQQWDSGVRFPGSEPRLCQFLTTGPWENYLSSLSSFYCLPNGEHSSSSLTSFLQDLQELIFMNYYSSVWDLVRCL